MGVLTGFHRVKADTLKMLEANPELADWLLGCTADKSAAEKLGFKDAAPSFLSIDRAWDEILILLAGTDHHEAYGALHISLWEEYDGCEELRLFSPAAVRNGLKALEKLDVERLRAEVLRRGLQAYDG